jgi:hypothetical protein
MGLAFASACDGSRYTRYLDRVADLDGQGSEQFRESGNARQSALSASQVDTGPTPRVRDRQVVRNTAYGPTRKGSSYCWSSQVVPEWQWDGNAYERPGNCIIKTVRFIQMTSTTAFLAAARMMHVPAVWQGNVLMGFASACRGDC